ncbi:MAG: RHS repeat-associated core domain-containing protein, partial [Planctomycetota bacterium]
ESPSDLTTTFTYNAGDQIATITDPRGFSTTHTYDRAKRLTERMVQDLAGNYVETFNFGDNGRMTSVVRQHQPSAGNPTSFETAFGYDARGLATSITNKLGETTTRTYDAQGRVSQEELPGGFPPTAYAYDVLGRRVKQTRPEGLEIQWNYTDGADARTVVYRDAKGQQTTYSYDGRGRLNETVYPDTTSEELTFDALGNATLVEQPDGTKITQTFDATSRVLSRTIEASGGTLPPTTESYAYADGLRRVTASRGNVSTELTYDSIGRLIKDETAGYAVTYSHDASGNPTQIGYPSEITVGQTFNARNQLQALTGSTIGTFGWLGDLPLSHQVGPTSMSRLYDGAGRLKALTTNVGSDLRLREDLKVDSRGLRTQSIRTDLGGLGWRWTLDRAGRLTEATQHYFTGETPAAGPASGRTSTSSSYGYTYDTAENLTQIRTTGRCSALTTDLPPDSRNRPMAYADDVLLWDDAGRLIQKGDHKYRYDANDRLIKVLSAADDSELASYTYDIHNRRLTKTVGTTTYRTVWDGWRAIEEYEVVDGDEDILRSRRTFGLGLDGIVKLEQKLPNAGLETYYPVYDSIGNVAALLNDTGSVVERYAYSPYGERTIWHDTEPPAIQQLRLEDGDLILELTEPVRDDVFNDQLNTGITLENLTEGESLTLAASRPVQSGPNAKQRIVLSTNDLINPNDQLRFTLAAASLRDFFDHVATDGVDETLTWTPAGTSVITDVTPPSIQAVCLIDKKLVVDFSEPVTESSAEAQLTINGAVTSWTVDGTGYSVELESALDAGSHVLAVGEGALDLAGLTANPAGPFSFGVSAQSTNQSIFEAPSNGEVEASAVGNVFGFQGLPLDSETGLFYVRNRMLDPELGRFITKDPVGYVDGPSAYAFAMNSPVNYGDPLGLFNLGLGPCGTKVGEAFDECMAPLKARERAFNESTHGQYINGTIQGAARSPVALGETIYQVVRHPIQTAKGLWHLVTHPIEVTADRIVDFQMAGPLERGRTIGGALGDLVLTGAAGKAVKVTRSSLNFDDVAEAAANGLRSGARELLPETSPRLLDVNLHSIRVGGSGLRPSRMTRATIVGELRGHTMQANRIADAIENGLIDFNVLSDRLFARAYYELRKGKDGLPGAFNNGRRVYIREGSQTFLSDVVHEGTHALDRLRGFEGSRYQLEKRAWFYERQFKVATGTADPVRDEIRLILKVVEAMYKGKP